jgi:hypothetical protein
MVLPVKICVAHGILFYPNFPSPLNIFGLYHEFMNYVIFKQSAISRRCRKLRKNHQSTRIKKEFAFICVHSWLKIMGRELRMNAIKNWLPVIGVKWVTHTDY